MKSTSKKRIITFPRLLSIGLVFILAAGAHSNYQSSYARDLPSDATEIQIERVSAGLFDHSIYLKAKVDEAGFKEFVSNLNLSPIYEHPADPRNPKKEVSSWWKLKERDSIFIREAYTRDVYYEKHPDNVRDTLWATYEEGYVYFTHINY